MDRTRIGFIGLGIMGAPMAGHLARAGYQVTVHDISQDRADMVASENKGVYIAETPKATALHSDIVITMLPSGKYVRDVVLGGNGLIHGFRSGSLVIDTSSSEPWLTVETSEALAKSGINMVDAPVSGAQAGAQSASLVFMVGGSKEAVERASPLLRAMGKSAFHLGPVGSGHTMKCINNLITAMSFMATVEGLVIGKQFGLDPNIMTDVLNVSTGMSWNSQNHIKQRITNRRFDDPFKLELMVKDIGIAMELAKSKGMPLALSAVGQELWRAAGLHSGKGSSISEMVRWVEQMTGTEIRA